MSELVKLRRDTRATLCLECGKCTPACPIAGLGGTPPRRIAAIELKDTVPGDGDGLGRCLSCAACEDHCPQGVEFTAFVRGARQVVGTSARKPCPHGEMFQNCAWLGTGAREPHRDLGLPDGLAVAERGDVGLFVGCLPYFDVLFRRDLGLETTPIAHAAVSLLNHLGIAPVVIPSERCCGHDLLWAGEEQAFRALGTANLRAFAERGVKHVLTTCAECLRTWKVDYAGLDGRYKPKVQHLAEFLAERVAAGEIRFEGEGSLKVTFHDPCRLGRHLGVYDAPRELLQAMPGTTTVEMKHNRRDARCCGTSGFQHCDAMSRSLQEGRLGEARAAGADVLLTACPKCLIHLNCAQDGARRRRSEVPQLAVLDLTQFAASRLRKPAGGTNHQASPAGEAGDQQ